MDWEFIAPMIVGTVAIVTTGGVLVLRPIAKRLGALLEVMAREKASLPLEEIRLLRDSMDTVHQRLSLMEERQDFTERLIGRGGDTSSLTPGPSGPPGTEG
ncbi:MAG: hypothetical protein ACR2QM_13310 [Longimicrobiales bacterium]